MAKLCEPKTNTSKYDVWTLPNVITLLRICLVPLFVVLLLSPWPEWIGKTSVITVDTRHYLAALMFILISCTDGIDGYLARKRNQVTNFGKFMDPLADKILVTAALIALVELGALPSWVVLIILTREFIVAGVRMIAAAEGVVIAASYLGKFKTVFQMVAIVLFTIKDVNLGTGIGFLTGGFMYWISWITMTIALLFTVASMLDYIAKARDLLGFGSSHTEEVEIEEVSPETLIEHATNKNVTFGCAESLTGGLIASTLTSVPGASAVVKGGIVSYTNEVKHNVLQVDQNDLDTLGAVSEEVAKEMADGARNNLQCDIAVSATGIAGPGGAEEGKPVGTVYLGISTPSGTYAKRYEFRGRREEVRTQTTQAAFVLLKEALETL